LFCSIWVRGSIFGNVSDNNNDDAGDNDLVGVFIVLKERNDTDIATTVTDSMGDWIIYDLPEGTCTVAETNLGDVHEDVKEVEGGKPSVISVIVRGGDNSTGNDFAD
jgi:hypothetical protein